MTYTTEETTPILHGSEEPSQKVGQPTRGAAWKSLLAFAAVLAAAVGYYSSSGAPALLVSSVLRANQFDGNMVCNQVPCGCVTSCLPPCDDKCPIAGVPQRTANRSPDVNDYVCNQVPCGCEGSCLAPCRDKCPRNIYWDRRRSAESPVPSDFACKRIPCQCEGSCRKECFGKCPIAGWKPRKRTPTPPPRPAPTPPPAPAVTCDRIPCGCEGSCLIPCEGTKCPISGVAQRTANRTPNPEEFVCDRVPCGCGESCLPVCRDRCPFSYWPRRDESKTKPTDFVCDRVPCGCPGSCLPRCTDKCPIEGWQPKKLIVCDHGDQCFRCSKPNRIPRGYPNSKPALAATDKDEKSNSDAT